MCLWEVVFDNGSWQCDTCGCVKQVLYIKNGFVPYFSMMFDFDTVIRMAIE